MNEDAVVENNRVLSLQLNKRVLGIEEYGSSMTGDFIVTCEQATTKPSEVCKDTAE